MIDTFEKRRQRALSQAAEGVQKAFANESLARRRELTLELAKGIDPSAFGLARSPFSADPKARAQKGGGKP